MVPCTIHDVDTLHMALLQSSGLTSIPKERVYTPQYLLQLSCNPNGPGKTRILIHITYHVNARILQTRTCTSPLVLHLRTQHVGSLRFCGLLRHSIQQPAARTNRKAGFWPTSPCQATGPADQAGAACNGSEGSGNLLGRLHITLRVQVHK